VTGKNKISLVTCHLSPVTAFSRKLKRVTGRDKQSLVTCHLSLVIGFMAEMTGFEPVMGF
jgi:hypothetical protein